MKKICALALVALLIAIPAMASTPKLDDGLLDRGREVMNLASYSEFDRAFDKGGFKSGTADDFAQYMQDNFYDLFNGTLQQDVAVCYYDGSTWTLAMPVLDPTDDNVETLLLTSADGRAFDGYACGRWGDAVSAADGADKAVWSGDYKSNSVIVQPDADQTDTDQTDTDQAEAEQPEAVEGDSSEETVAVPDA